MESSSIPKQSVNPTETLPFDQQTLIELLEVLRAHPSAFSFLDPSWALIAVEGGYYDFDTQSLTVQGHSVLNQAATV
jgi:hypothetical protein